jgi:hypothetical protein
VAFLDRLGEGNEVLRAETVGLGGQGHDDPASVAGVPVPLDEFVVLEAVHQGVTAPEDRPSWAPSVLTATPSPANRPFG